MLRRGSSVMEGGEVPLAGAALQTPRGVEADIQPTDTLLW
ncbi:hypothetical protein P775_24630 [Puniceibacterium antarcticum]|uniref:Uncharacterized protein n=1 Tax=Puniceibacterium antarcticum TaxID=1206336 RepID=A0A2G8R6S7_9RHOB|nr:hypothetical protein P775_24630 [Puniceibacterium antarcticum]